MRIVLATRNAKKVRELGALLAALGVAVEPLDPSAPEVVEDGATFAANAAAKAASAARHARAYALADDSGVEVDALGGLPGVRSARFAGEPADDARNNAELLRRLADVPDEGRGARFVCALALAEPDGRIALALEGTAHGRILHAPRGDGDFGYDPLFLFTEPGHAATGRTFAELDPAEKSAASHRGRAFRALAERLATLVPGMAHARRP